MANAAAKEIDGLMTKCSKAVADDKREACLAQLEALVKKKKRKKGKSKTWYFLDKSRPKKQRKKASTERKLADKGSHFGIFF